MYSPQSEDLDLLVRGYSSAHEPGFAPWCHCIVASAKWGEAICFSLCLVEAQSSCCGFSEPPLLTAFASLEQEPVPHRSQSAGHTSTPDVGKCYLWLPTAHRLACTVCWVIGAESQMLWWVLETEEQT